MEFTAFISSSRLYLKHIFVFLLGDWSFPCGASGKKLPNNAGDVRDMSSILRSGRSSGEGHGNPIQYSCLENPTDRGAW